MSTVLGLVLCGGESRRMGKDKAQLDLAGTSLIRRALDVIEPLADELVLGTGSAARYKELGLDCVLDSIEDAGPLAGLCAGLELAEQRGHEWLTILACDTPRLDTSLYRVLLETARSKSADACLLRSASGVEPLCAVYRVTCLASVRDSLASGQRKLIAFHGAVEIAFVTEADLPERLQGADLTFNVNTPQELEAERKRLASQNSTDLPRQKKRPTLASAESIA